MPSYILKCTVGDKHFICNRNKTFLQGLTTKYMRWWEACNIEWLSDCDSVEVLEEYDYLDNTNLCDQKTLNQIKQRWRETDPELNENESICDIIIKNDLKKIKQHFKIRYEEVMDEYSSLHISESTKNLYRWYFFKNGNWRRLLDMPRYKWEELKINNSRKYVYYLFNKDRLKLHVDALFEDRKMIKQYADKGGRLVPKTVKSQVGKITRYKTVYIPDKWITNDESYFDFLIGIGFYEPEDKKYFEKGWVKRWMEEYLDSEEMFMAL